MEVYRMFEGKTQNEIYHMLETDPALLASVRQASELVKIFKELSKEDKEIVIKGCDAIGAKRTADALRQIAGMESPLK